MAAGRTRYKAFKNYMIFDTFMPQGEYNFECRVGTKFRLLGWEVRIGMGCCQT